MARDCQAASQFSELSGAVLPTTRERGVRVTAAGHYTGTKKGNTPNSRLIPDVAALTALAGGSAVNRRRRVCMKSSEADGTVPRREYQPTQVPTQWLN
jgi:hypothetical protein